jgi:hypothetical protein
MQRLLALRVYRNIYSTAERFLVDYAARIDPRQNTANYVIGYFRDRWRFRDPDRLPFRSHSEIDPNMIWREAHLFEE